MTCWLRLWDPKIGQWVLHDIYPTPESAKEAARVLWRKGAAGVRIEEKTTTVLLEHRR